MAAVLKTASRGDLARGFESHALRTDQRKSTLACGDQPEIHRMCCPAVSGRDRLPTAGPGEYAEKLGQDRVRVKPQSSAFIVIPAVIAERFFDTAPVDFLVPGDALGVDPQQHIHTVPGPFGNLRRFHSTVQPS